MRRAAFFELRADFFGRPFEDGIIRALLDANFAVDLFAPEGELPQTIYPDSVRRLAIEYRRRWLQSHLNPLRWRTYDLFLGTTDLPMAFAGVAAQLARRPLVTAADEIFVGGYEGSATGAWKTLARRAMHRATFTILTDLCRIPLQREYANLPGNHEYFAIPSCYSFPYTGRSREAARASLGIAPDDFVVSFTGTFTENNGAHWVVRLLDAMPDVRVLIQPGGHTNPVLDALLARDRRVIHLPERAGWMESMELTVAADVGLVFYLSPKPQFQFMGVSSQKLCTYLWLDIPVIATRQPSFEFVERFRCGELIDGDSELAAAVARVRANRGAYETRRAIAEYIDPAEKVRLLSARFRAL
jgi:glycosyltransferase involved in cell wall biosynthesis